jgi:predicted TIM-barrel fold metal-dependent hydrolase
MEDKLIIVSSDSHAGVPKELWSQYLPERYHELLPNLREDNEIYPQAIYLLGAKGGASTSLPEVQEAHQVDWHGLHDPVLRLADMDREGVTAELIYHGDFRLGDMFHNVTGRVYSYDAWEDGARGWNRWAADTFGFAMHRFLVTGAIGPCIDMDATVAELEWIADHKFTGTYGPGYMWHRDMPPLFDAYWEPFWSTCEERGIAIVVHAGFGTEFGTVFPEIERIYNDVATAAGSTDPASLFEHADAVSDDSLVFFNDFLNHNVDSRRPMWQMMFGGVFDRHPDLKLLLTEIRLDWIPATLRHLDAVYEQHRDTLPAKRKPSEYWATNCLAGASFIHRAEVEMRHEIGVETMLFGRDFPHPEGTWPNTDDFLRLAFAGVPDDEARLILGENAIRFLDLDREPLAEIAKRIGPRLEAITGGGGPEVRPELIANFDQRSGFLKPAEGEAKLPMVDTLLKEDLAAVGVTA